jgi:hypothetical protein
MDLTNLAGLLKPMSSVLAGALLGPAGAAVAPVIVGELAKVLGIEPTADAVADALIADPEGAAPIVASTGAALVKTLEEIEAGVLEAINQTARAELESESAFVKMARPFNIWVIGVVTGGYGLCLVAATAAAIWLRDPAALNLLVANAGVLGIALAPSGAVAGVSAWGRTKEKLAGASNIATTAANVASTLAGAINKGSRR